GCTVQARSLIESGSEATFITERLFNLIKFPFKTIHAQVSGLNQTISAQSTKLCHFSIRSPSRPGLELETAAYTAAYVLPPLEGNLPSYRISRDLLKGLPDIPLADLNFFEGSKVDVLLGADILPSILLGNSKSNTCMSLLGQETIFGWVLTGPLSPANPRSVSVFSTRVARSLGDSLVQGFDSGCEHNSVSTPSSIYTSHHAARWQSADDPTDPGQILDSKVIFITMSPRPRNAQSLESRCTRGIQSYRCRVCNGIHPLKKCRHFLHLSAEKRLRAVLVSRYCWSCLAHEHSDGSCRRGDGCKTCGQDHHTLLHPVTEEHRSQSAGDSTRGS
ncbi:hypothetical protein KR074_007797, partial [Drosophila pseudoananassae]